MVSLTERGSEWVVCWLSVCGWMVNFFGPLFQKRQNEKQLRLSKSQIEVRECRVLSIEMGPRGLSGGGCALLRPFLVTWRATIGLEGYKQEGDKEPSSQRDHAPLSLDMCVCVFLSSSSTTAKGETTLYQPRYAHQLAQAHAISPSPLKKSKKRV